MAFRKMIAQLILAIEHLTTIGMSTREEGAVVLLHMTAELSRTTEGSRAPVRTLGKSSDSNVVALAVDWRNHRCDRDFVMDVGVRSDGCVDRLWGCGIDSTLFQIIRAIDVVEYFIITREVVGVTAQHGSGIFS